MSGARARATFDATLTALGAAFAFVPFLPRLVRAPFTGRRDRARTVELLRAGAGVRPAEPAADPAARGTTPGGRPLRILLVAGEPSGDLYAADLATALLRLRPDARIDGIGGPRMAAAGVAVRHDLVSDPVMGVWPVVRKAPAFFRLYRDVVAEFEQDPPDVVVGVDYPGLNLRLARAARRRGVPFVVYVAPQVWAWAPWRTRRLARDAARVLPILPFEQAIFEASGVRASYVGHPLFAHIAARPGDAAYRARLRGGPESPPLVALLPGSRRSEVRANLPLLLAAARRAAEARPGLRFVVPLANERLRVAVEAGLRDSGIAADVAPPDHSDDAMAAACAAVTVSGTATLHLAAHGVPAVIVYRTSAASRVIARLLLVSPWIGLPNLLAGEEILPEFLAGDADGPRIGDALLRLLPGGDDAGRAAASLAALRARLTVDGVPDRAARWVLASIPTRR